MIKRIILPVILVLCVISFGKALYAQQAPPEKLMIYNGTDWKVQLYGFIKLDVVYNTRDVFHDAGPLWVMNQSFYNAFGTYNAGTATIPAASGDNNRGSIMFDIRQTRLGIRITGPTILGAMSDAVIEADFWGDMPTSGTPSRHGQFRMRHAFVRLKWQSDNFTGYIMVGQFWSFMMPWDPFNPSPYAPKSALPDMVTFIPLACSGLLFMREPLVAVGGIFGPESYNVELVGSLARPQSGSDAGTGIFAGSRSSQIDEIGPGESSGMPSYRARITFFMKPAQGFSLMFGSAYHFQKERHQVCGAPINTLPPTGHLVNSWAVLGFAKLQAWMFTLTGHYYVGTNLDTFFGGINQGVVVDNVNGLVHSVPTRAGWGEFRIDLQKVNVPLVLNFGYGRELVYNRYWMPVDTRLSNEMFYANFWLYLHSRMRIGFEYGLMSTQYKYEHQRFSSDSKYHLTCVLMF